MIQTKFLKFIYLKTESYYATLTSLDLAMKLNSALNSQRSVCFCLLEAVTKGVHEHTQRKVNLARGPDQWPTSTLISSQPSLTLAPGDLISSSGHLGCLHSHLHACEHHSKKPYLEHRQNGIFFFFKEFLRISMTNLTII